MAGTDESRTGSPRPRDTQSIPPENTIVSPRPRELAHSQSGGALLPIGTEAVRRRLSVRAVLVLVVLAGAIVGGGYFVWQQQTAAEVPFGLAKSNGRLEAQRIDVSTRYGGRLDQVLVAEGDLVKAGQVVAVMDTATLQAQLSEAQAATRQAEHQLDQAKALVAQRESELTVAKNDLDRATELGKKGFATQQQVEQRQSAAATAEAALRSARAQVALSKASIDAARAHAQAIKTQIADATLVAPRGGRVQYRLALPGEVLPAGGRVITLLDLTDVYMTVFLPTRDAGRLALGSEARLVFDAAPQYVIPATVTYVASEAQFTPKFVETQSEREKLMFRVKLQIPSAILEKYVDLVKAGLTGVAYVKVARNANWPAWLQVKLPP